MSARSSPPAGLLGRVFQYIDLHQDEFVQVGETTPGRLAGVPSGIRVNGCVLGDRGFFLPDSLIPLKMPVTPRELNQSICISVRYELAPALSPRKGARCF